MVRTETGVLLAVIGPFTYFYEIDCVIRCAESAISLQRFAVLYNRQNLVMFCRLNILLL